MAGTSVETSKVNQIILNFTIEAQKKIPESLQRKKKRVIVLAGPTACGKSHLALRLAKLTGGEIISADSMQVYKGMDIGTAKPTKEERLEIPHHLLDIRNICDSFNVVDFYYEAHQACQQVLERGNIPIVVGGSGFYIHALIYGPPSGPPSVPELRQALEEEIERVGPQELYNRLIELDPQYAKTITKNDKQKIVRALEIITLTNKKVSKMAWKGRRRPQNYDFHCWYLFRPKEKLYKRTDLRCDQMLSEGFLNEVIRLEQEGLRSNSSACQAIGYRQALDFLETNRSPEEYENFVAAFKQATRHYVKRQFTWFKKEPIFHWLDVDMHDPEVVCDLILQDYETL